MTKRLLTDVLALCGVLFLALLVNDALPGVLAAFIAAHVASWLALLMALAGVLWIVGRFLRYFR